VIHRRGLFGSLLALGLILASGCGDDDDTTSGQEAGTQAPLPAASAPATEAATEEPAATTAVTQATEAEPETTQAAQPADGEPIKIGGVFGMEGPPGTPEFPEILAGVQGAVDSINAHGGVNGRPLDLVVCADKGDANVAAACGRTLVDEGVVAVVGSAGRFSANWFPITAAAGIPFVGPPIGAAELSEPLSFPPTLGTFGGNVGAGSIAADLLGVQNLGVAYVDVASAAQSTMIIDKVLEMKGLPTSKRVPVPINTPDMSSYAATVTDGTEAVYMAMTTADGDKLTQAIRQSGADVTIIRSAATFPASSIETLGDLAEGIYQPSQLKSPSNSSDPEVAQFLEELQAANPNATANDLASSAWSSVYTFADAASKAATIDPAGLVEELGSGDTFAAPMTAGPVQFATPVAATGLPRAFNTKMTFFVVEDGKFVTANDNQFVDPFAGV
jgi:branched-chain amino acid transport system substrate-binding protein